MNKVFCLNHWRIRNRYKYQGLFDSAEDQKFLTVKTLHWLDIHSPAQNVICKVISGELGSHGLRQNKYTQLALETHILVITPQGSNAVFMHGIVRCARLMSHAGSGLITGQKPALDVSLCCFAYRHFGHQLVLVQQRKSARFRPIQYITFLPKGTWQRRKSCFYMGTCTGASCPGATARLNTICYGAIWHQWAQLVPLYDVIDR